MFKKIAAGVAVLGLGGAGAVTAQEAPPTVDLTITEKKVAVAGAEALRSGPTRLVMDLQGKGERGIVVVRLERDVTVEEITEVVPKIRNPAQAERYGDFVASTFLVGGREYATTLTLEPATYVVVDITERAAVRASFTVGTEPNGAVAALPATTIGLEDYEVDMPSRIPADGAIRVENRGEVLHHLLAFPLRKGVDGKRLVRKIKRGKEPRKAFAGPPSAPVEVVSPGTVNDVEVARRPGKVLYVCFLQDKAKAPPHAALGMVKVVTVE